MRKTQTRLWIGPGGQVVDLDEVDMPHSMSVATDPHVYGLERQPVQDHMERFNAGEAEFAYDLLIVMAEMNGWCRLSSDGGRSEMALSAATVDDARKALAVAMAHGAHAENLTVEIETVVGDVIRRGWFRLDDLREQERFVRLGRRPPFVTWDETISEEAYLIEALGRTGGPGPAAAADVPTARSVPGSRFTP